MVKENHLTEVNQISQLKNEGKIWPQVLAILIGCLAYLTCGILLSWTSPFIVKITRDKEFYDITENEASYFTVIPPISMILGSLIFSRLNDVFGRKPVILFVGIPYIAAWILAAVAKNVWVFYASRFSVGLADGCLYSSLPMYIGEISIPKVRGTWGNAMVFFLNFGQFFISVIGTYFNVQQTSYICICFPVIYLILFSFMPESPYYYMMKAKYEEARLTLKWLQRKQDVEEDFLQLKADVERQMSESGTWKDLFTIKSNRKALLAGIFLRVSQQLSGMIACMLYTQSIFERAGGNISPEISSMIFFATVLCLNPIGGSILDRLGRKKAYILSSFFCGIVLLIEAIYFYLDVFKPQIDVQFLNWVPITGLILFVVFYMIGLGLVPTLMLGELFSTSVKVKGLCFLNVVYAILIVTVASVFHVLNTNVGLYAPFLLFSLCCFLSTVLSFYLVPETKGKTLEDIQQSLKRRQKTTET